ncbi:MAG: MBL fold metallo-hydrolase [Bacilli bacterium]|nr:MBL fold metallo-hydrolase [Bacilli bacterium]
MKVTPFCYDTISCNSFVVGEEGGPCVLIDCGSSGNGRLFSYISRHHSRLEGVLITHGHYDHIAALGEVPKGVPIFLANEDFVCLSSPNFNASRSLAEDLVLPEEVAPYPVEDEDEVALPDFAVKVIATPFHTEGSVCYLFPNDNLIFTGDTLFRYGYGRTDLPGGDERKLIPSLRKLAKLDPNLRLYCGHGPSSTLGQALSNIGFNSAYL